MLEGKTVLLGMTRGVAAYETADLASMLVKEGVKVYVLMAENATHFINPMTFKSLAGSKCLVGTFDRNSEFSMEYAVLARQVDVVMVAPTSASVIGKVIHGIADNMLTTTIMTYRYKEILAPTVSTNMYENPILQDNLDICGCYGVGVITPAWGYLACGDTGAGKMPEPEVLYEYILREAGYPGDLAGRRILVTAGPTGESIDPVRCVTDHFTGRMGYAIARMVAYKGADVALVNGPVDLDRPLFVETVPVENIRKIFKAVAARSGERGIVVKVATVADYRPFVVGTEEIKKSDGDLPVVLERTDDILRQLEQNRGDGQFLCGFSMETQNILENSRTKLAKRWIDMTVASNLKVKDAGFDTDTNVVTLITRENETEFPIMSKEKVVDRLLTEILKQTKGQGGLNPT